MVNGSHFLCLRFCAYSHFLVSTVLVPTKLLPTLGCLLFFCPPLESGVFVPTIWFLILLYPLFCCLHIPAHLMVRDGFVPTPW